MRLIAKGRNRPSVTRCRERSIKECSAKRDKSIDLYTHTHTHTLTVTLARLVPFGIELEKLAKSRGIALADIRLCLLRVFSIALLCRVSEKARISNILVGELYSRDLEYRDEWVHSGLSFIARLHRLPW